MEQEIRYARSFDGAHIAFSTIGDGLPFVEMPSLGPWSHLELEWQMPQIRRWCELLAARHKLVRYDRRGAGLSDRAIEDYSLEAMERDLAAVVDHLGLERFALRAGHVSGPAAIAYAAHNPDRVSHLMLWCTYARGADFYDSPEIQGLRELRRTHWGLYTETVSHAFLGWSEGAEAHQFAALIRESIAPETAEAAWIEIARFDVSDLLPHVRSRVLVLHRRQLSWLDVGIARSLAARIADARLTVLEGRSLAPYLGDMQSAIRAIESFTQDSGQAARTTGGAPPGMAVILFTDIADSTALTERLGDAAFRTASRALDEAMRAAIRQTGGTPVDGKVLGDGVMGVFTSAAQAIDAARKCLELSAESELQLHIGLHAGDVIREKDNVYGGAVNIASRICSLCEPGEILVSATIRELARTSAGVAFEDRGEHMLKGIEDPVRVFAVRKDGA